MELGGNGNPYKMHTSIADQINDNLRNMILTNQGERLGKYDYGANLRQILAGFSTNPEVETIVMQSIMATVEKYMPFVSLDTFEIQRRGYSRGLSNLSSSELQEDVLQVCGTMQHSEQGQGLECLKQGVGFLAVEENRLATLLEPIGISSQLRQGIH